MIGNEPAPGPGAGAGSGRIPVRFRGEGAGVEELSWGQLEIWGAMVRQRTWLPIGATSPLPAGTTVEDVAAELRFMMERYQAARTRLRFDADGVKQVVSSRGEILLEIIDAERTADPAAVAAQVDACYRERDYDFVNEWPVRMAVVRHRGVPTYRVLVMCHLVTDAAGAVQMLAELAAWRRARAGDGDPVAPATAMQAMAQARWQRTPAGRRVEAAAQRHWEQILRRIPPHRFPRSRDPRQPRHWHGEFHSRAMLLAVRAIAARLQVASAPILLTLYAVALARVTGVHPVVAQVITNNRFRPGLAGTVSPASQTGLCVLDVAGATVAEAVARVRRRTMTAYKHAYYDPRRMEDLIARVNQERGEQVDVGCFFNDRRRFPEAVESGPVPTAAQIDAALPESTFRWTERTDTSYEHLFIHLENVPDRIGITLAGDTHRIGPADMAACVRGMEQVAVAAARDPAAPTGVPAPPDGTPG